MRRLLILAALIPLAACGTSATGLFRGNDGSLVELHHSPDGKIRGYLREGSEHLASLLARTPREAAASRAEALNQAGALILQQGD